VNKVPDGGGRGTKPATRVVAVGIDTASTEEVSQALADIGRAYLERVFTPSELSSCLSCPRPEARLAAAFAAKEATLKALAVTGGQPAWTNMEVNQERNGSYQVHLAGEAAALAHQRGIGRLTVSFSAVGQMATAVVVATGTR
jgi:holo-[acyl-carrier protein] synthase